MHYGSWQTRLAFQFLPFVNYIRREWLGVVGVESLSLYRAPCRTNNSVESNNAFLGRETKAHGPVWELMSKLYYIFSPIVFVQELPCCSTVSKVETLFFSQAVICQLSQDAFIHFGIYQRGIDLIKSKPSLQTKLNEENTQRSWDLLDQGLVSPKTFVERMKYRVGGCEFFSIFEC